MYAENVAVLPQANSAFASSIFNDSAEAQPSHIEARVYFPRTAEA